MIVVDACITEHAQLKPFLEVLISIIKEQLIHVEQFNIISCIEGVQKWRQELTDSTEENIADAIHWVEHTRSETTPFRTNVGEGLVMALAHSDAEAVYIFSHKEDTLRSFELLQDKVVVESMNTEYKWAHTDGCVCYNHR